MSSIFLLTCIIPLLSIIEKKKKKQSFVQQSIPQPNFYQLYPHDVFCSLVFLYGGFLFGFRSYCSLPRLIGGTSISRNTVQFSLFMLAVINDHCLNPIIHQILQNGDISSFFHLHQLKLYKEKLVLIKHFLKERQKIVPILFFFNQF